MTEETILYFCNLRAGERALARVVELMHKCVPRINPSTFRYCQGTTEIGPTATMSCLECGEIWDITDYESW